jgi:hypothetical protein
MMGLNRMVVQCAYEARRYFTDRGDNCFLTIWLLLLCCRYEKSYMHRDIVTTVAVSSADFFITGSADGEHLVTPMSCMALL